MPVKVLAAEITVVLGCLITMAHGIFSQADMGSNTTVVGALTLGFTTMLGLMAWVLKRLLDTTIPQQQATFTAAINKLVDTTIPGLQETFTAGIDSQRNSFAEVLTKQRDTFAQAHEKQLVTFDTAQKNFGVIVENTQKVYREELQHERVFYRELLTNQLTSLLSNFNEEQKKSLTEHMIMVRAMTDELIDRDVEKYAEKRK